MKCLEFVGNLVNSDEFTLGVIPDCTQELMFELEGWRVKHSTTQKELESLIGKLQIVSNVIKSGLLFISRLLAEMRGMPKQGKCILSSQARKDVMWWYCFLPTFKGMGILWYLDCEEVNSEFAVDMCLVAAGGVRGNECFRIQFPSWLQQCNIAHF